ncbi:MAG: DUF418 domain-containing protein [bacterium]|nr:DUF418 domain-containing protein [bacterium]
MPTARILGYDFARALAIIGMVLVNFKIVFGAEQNGPDWLVWISHLFSGRAAATFVILAGVGLTLLSRKAFIAGDAVGTRQNRLVLLKRSVFLMVVGLAYTPIWPADILHFYAVYIAVGALLLTVSSKRLVGTAFAFMLGFLVLLVLFNYEAEWNFVTLEYAGFWTFAGMFKHLFYNGFHPVFPWTFFLLMGMWLGRQDLQDPRRRGTILKASLAIFAVTESLAWCARTFITPQQWGMPKEDIAVLLGTGPMPPFPQYLLSAGATAIMVICLSVALTEKFKTAPSQGIGSRLIASFISAGQLALTLYVAHVVIGMGIIYTLGMQENRSLYFVYGYTFVFCLIGILFSHLWRKKFKRGPLEAVMRKLAG